MPLDKNDLNQIKRIVEISAENTEKKIRKDIYAVDDKLTSKIEALDNKFTSKIGALDTKIDSVKHEIISVISREVTDLAEINIEVIKRVDRIGELENRIVRLETKLGLKPL